MAKKARIPVPDPLGVLEELTENGPIQLWDPLRAEIFGEEEGSEVDEALEHIKKAAESLECDFCKGLNVNLSEYLMKYDIIKKLQKEGRTIEEAKRIYQEEYDSEVKRKVARLQKDLKLKDKTIQNSKNKFGEVLTKSLRGD